MLGTNWQLLATPLGALRSNNNALPDHLFYALADSEVPVPENTTQEEANSSSGGSHDSSSDIDECSNSIKFTTPKEKKGKIKSKKAKKDASQDDNNEQLDHTCDADVLCKECSENYYKTKKCE
ncbi:hypothetical protein AVEN_26763-1 [Araneus ventricosus]|uniref:Uncharacterized protein n=1 Tax=Araneus ventricosus TaxID=182803 RepID=A0A4Y2D792_ARAVE|nr:hypothetical protein AVEN_26763-1 [Araneus ventricosus]